MLRPAARLRIALAFWPLLALWTWLLVRPDPIPAVVSAVPLSLRFIAAKCLHASAYAALAVLGTLWPASRLGRVGIVGLLLAHGVGTEIVQTYVPNRTGAVRDVIVDWAGIVVGLMIMRKFVWIRLMPGPVLPTNGDG